MVARRMGVSWDTMDTPASSSSACWMGSITAHQLLDLALGCFRCGFKCCRAALECVGPSEPHDPNPPCVRRRMGIIPQYETLPHVHPGLSLRWYRLRILHVYHHAH